jgi:hypothetical protein
VVVVLTDPVELVFDLVTVEVVLEWVVAVVEEVIEVLGAEVVV